MARVSVERAGGASVGAFLDMLALCEFGTELLKESDDGYDLIVGSLPGHLDRFTDYSHHPEKEVWIPAYHVNSSAAGRGQIIAPTWHGLVRVCHFADFSPVSQDLGCIELLRECKALPQILAGAITQAIESAHEIWASLPGSTAGQQVRSVNFCLTAYTHALNTYVANAKPDFSNVLSGVDTTAPVPAWAIPKAA